MTRRGAPALITAPALVVMLVVAGCGSSSLSAAQLHSGANRACAAARRALAAVRTPRSPAGGAAFLSRGIRVLEPELTALERLHPGGDQASSYARARDATRQELSALQSTLKGVKAGNDPVVAIKTLQQQLLPLERRAATAWAATGVLACAAT